MNQPRRSGMGPFFAVMLLMIVVYSWMASGSMSSQAEESNQVEFINSLEAGQVVNVTIRQGAETPTGTVVYEVTGGAEYAFNVPDVAVAEQLLVEAGFTEYSITPVESELDIISIITLLITVAAVIFMIIFLTRGAGGGSNAKMMNFGKSRATMVVNSKIDFKGVAGLAEEKEDLQELVDFLKDPSKFTRMGARIPKGILMVGSPGTGKTLMAKAIAGEAGVPFFSISGSDFVEMFVGVGASRVRDLFAEAKKNSPCIVFIDEIDAVARRRGSGMGGGHDEREQTLNQLLVEMDGFSVNSGIIVVAATNRVDILDPAIMRPGRFDRKIHVNRPDVRGREEILKVHSKDKPLGEDVDLKRVAQTTSGYTGADLENLMNEAAIRAARDNRPFIEQKDIDEAFAKVSIGTEKKSRIVSDEDKRITAYHEAGHAILFHVLPHVGPVHTVSIIPTNMGAGGYTMPLPEKDESYMTRGRMLEHIMVSLGGRIAEEMILDDITTGASQDIKQATGIARDMVTRYGMSDKVGMVNCDSGDEVFLGRDMARTQGYSEQLATTIDSEVKRIIDECYAEAKKVIEDNKEILHQCAELLLQKEKIYQDEFEALFPKKLDGDLLKKKEEC